MALKKHGDILAFGDKVIVLIDKSKGYETTNSGIIVADKEEKLKNRGIVVHSAVEDIKKGHMIYYKYGRTLPCKLEKPGDEYVVVEKENIWAIDISESVKPEDV